LEEVLTHNFFRCRSWFETFLYLPIDGDVGGTLWKDGTYTLQLLFGSLLKAYYLHIKFAVSGHSESKVLTHQSCCWRALWKQGAYRLQLLLGTPLKADTFKL